MENKDLLNNRYRLLEYIGSGGMAEVYRGHDTLLDREVAVKILHKQFVTDENFIARFKREAKAAAKLSHPSIVNIYDVGQKDDVNFIIMEYVAGGTLKQVIESQGRLSAQQSIKIALDIASALSHAHLRGLVHCDIKPHNILIDNEGKAKVADFGIARAVASATVTFNNDVIGSVHYISPEQAAGKNVTAQSDIYSLGVVLFEMLTGKVPFVAESAVAVALKHIKDNPPLLREYDEDISPVLESIVSKSLSKNPQDRYNTANELINELKRAQMLVKDSPRSGVQNFNLYNEQEISVPDQTVVLPQSEVQEHLKVTKRKTTVRKSIYIILIIILLSVGFVIGMFAVYGKFWSAKDVTVPDVVGKQQNVAEELLKENSLFATVEEEESEDVKPGLVIRQNPEAGRTVKERRHVTIVVSKVLDGVVVPELKNLSLQEATNKLEGMGLKVGRVQESINDKMNENIVLEQYPLAKGKLSKGSGVDLIISKKTPKKVKVPNVTGLNIEKARAKLAEQKLALGTITEVPSAGRAGEIVEQTPGIDTEVVENSKVNVVVSTAKSAPPVTSSTRKDNIVEFVVPQIDGLHSVKIVVVRDGNRSLVYENTHKGGERIRQTIENSGRGDVRVEFYSNGALLEERRV